MNDEQANPAADRPLNTGSHPAFFDYYAKQSQTEATRQRFMGIRDATLRVLRAPGSRVGPEPWDVADIGCNAGTQSLIWSTMGHRVHALDINQPLLDLARQRAQASGQAIDFRLGSATALPWDDASMDVCLVPELLEHVREWRQCMNEFARILRPGGALLITTSNWLCPVQEEFTLPLYSWYPGWLKRRYEQLAVTTRPEIANHATFPAVNWFSPYSLARELNRLGLDTHDRFDLLALSPITGWRRRLVQLIRAVPPLRLAGHVMTDYSFVVGVRRAG